MVYFKEHHIQRFLEPRYPALFKDFIKSNYVSSAKMKSHVQILSTPTADTPGTTLLLHFDNKRYLIGNLAEGTQRAAMQMGARLLKVSECFLTGRTEWKNTGGMIGMILTLADSAASSQQSSQEELLKKARVKARKLGVQDDEEKVKQLEEEAKLGNGATLKLFGPPNLNHTLATARRFVFRKGMPVDAHEIRSDRGHSEAPDDEWAPFWADENIGVWAMSISPSRKEASSAITPPTMSPRKRSYDEANEVENETGNPALDGISEKDRDYLTNKAVVSEMFNSTWRLDTLYETPLSEVKMPASIFMRDPTSHKIVQYRGPKPGGKQPLPDPNLLVLVRKPWPGALVEGLPPTKPAKEAISYIFRNHMQRGKFHPERAQQLKVPKGRGWAELTKGNNVLNADGETITPDMVLDPSRVGGGIAVVDLPGPEYIDNLVGRAEWREPKVMEGVGAIVWICGKDVATDSRLHAFMQEFANLEHIVSSPEYCPNNISLDSVAAATIRLKQVDPDRYGVPVHDSETPDGSQEYGGSSHFQQLSKEKPLPEKAHVAARGQIVELEPAIKFSTREAIKALSVPEAAAELPEGVMEEAMKAQEACKSPDEDMMKWRQSLPPGAEDAEVISLGTGSALPSKYRNVSATLVRVPGWGNMLLDCGENTLGQLKRVFTAAELKEVLRSLRLLVISHMHADHHLGTAGVIKAWYEEVHGGQPAPKTSPPETPQDIEELFKNKDRLAVISEPAMQQWLREYDAVEDYGYSRLAPLILSPFTTRMGVISRLSWFVPPSELRRIANDDKMEKYDSVAVPCSLLNLKDLQAVRVKHCHGARAVSITTPSGFKVSYSGDCRPSQEFSRIGKGSTVCIHEATFDDELAGDAKAKNHSTTSEALGVAQDMGAKACVLTHFSQRYQKVPVLERAEGQAPVIEDVPMSNSSVTPPGDEGEENPADPEDDMDAPLEENDVAATFPDQQTGNGAAGQQYELPPKKQDSAPEAVKFKLMSDMKVCVAFDYMRVKVGDIGLMEKFTPALLKLFAVEEEQQKPAADEAMQQSGKSQSKKEKKDKKGKSVRHN